VIDWLSQIDEAIFLAINGAWPSGDTLMWWVSKPETWVPLYVVIMVTIWRVFKKSGSRGVVFVGLIIAVVLADVISARVLKPVAARVRPSHRVDLVEDVALYSKSDGTKYRGGEFGFVSSHAANHMAVAVFVGGLFVGTTGSAGVFWFWGLLVWAVVIGYSRIHLGVHFPGDVVFGWLLGGVMGAVVLKVVRHRMGLTINSEKR
jgi:undecaprenyl-diphosphatase